MDRKATLELDVARCGVVLERSKLGRSVVLELDGLGREVMLVRLLKLVLEELGRKVVLVLDGAGRNVELEVGGLGQKVVFELELEFSE